MANESGGLVKTRSGKSRAKVVRVNGVRIEYEASPVEKASRRRSKGHSPEAELPQDHAATSRAKRSSKRSTITFGSVTIKGSRLPIEEMRRNIASGNSALGRAAKAFVKAGVKLHRGKNIPLYRADPEDPGVLIRELNGRIERGALVDGEFKRAE